MTLCWLGSCSGEGLAYFLQPGLIVLLVLDADWLRNCNLGLTGSAALLSVAQGRGFRCRFLVQGL